MFLAIQDTSNKCPLTPALEESDDEKDEYVNDGDDKDVVVRAITLCEDEKEHEKEKEAEEMPEKPHPALEQRFSDGDKAESISGGSARRGAAKGSKECVAVRTVEGDRTGIAQMRVLNDGERVLTQNALGEFALWRVADLARVEEEEEEGERDVPPETPFGEYAKRLNEGTPKERGLPRGLRVDTSTGVFQVVVREGKRTDDAAFQSIRAVALKEGSGVDLFHTQSLGEGTAATTTHYKDPAALFREEQQ